MFSWYGIYNFIYYF